MQTDLGRAIDAFLVEYHDSMTVCQMAAALEMDYWGLIARRARLARGGVISLTRAAYRRCWTEDEDATLSELWGLKSDRAIGRRLGRTATACQVRAKRLGLTRTQAFWTARDVAKMFGVDQKVVTHRWFPSGLIVAKRAPFRIGSYRTWHVSQRALKRFVRQHPEEYDWRRMADGPMRELARAVWAEDPLLLLTEAAELMGVHPETLRRKALRGELPTTRLSWGAGGVGLIKVRRSALLKLEFRRVA